MLEEVYVVNENGQKEINFESLALMTSEEFVEKVKFYLGYTEIINVGVKDYDFSFVLLVDSYFDIYNFRYDKSTGRIGHDVFSKHDLELLGFVKNKTIGVY